jgi:hypothetical protein
MPQMNGRQLCSGWQLCARAESLYISGYTADLIAHRGCSRVRFGQTFTSPPGPKVREALDQEQAAPLNP